MSLVSLNGRIPRWQVRWTMTPSERMIYAQLNASENQLTQTHCQETHASAFVRFSAGEYRCALQVSDSSDRHVDGPRIPLDQEAFARIHREQAAVEAVLCRLRTDQLNELATLHNNGRLAELLSSFNDTLQHMPPVVMFVGNVVYSSLAYFGVSLLSRKTEGVFCRLSNTHPSEWSYDERDVVCAFRRLLESGPYYRLEEMNWMQVDPVTVTEFLRIKLEGLERAVPDLEATLSAHNVSIEERIRSAENSLLKETVPFRRIDGFTLNKSIVHLDFPCDEQQLESELRDLILSQLDIPEFDGDWTQLVALAVPRAIEQGALNALIIRLLELGQNRLNADFFMSRAPKRLFLCDNYLSLTKQDFACAILARRSAFGANVHDSNDLTLEKVRAAATAQASRMEFNGWKFWYGNLSPEEREPNQYYFFPPRISDLAQHEDAHHAGHAANGVVQSIRCPGVLFLSGKGRSARRRFEAVFDVRAVRSRATPRFTDQDLITCTSYARLLGTFYQVICDEMPLQNRYADKETGLQSIVRVIS